MNPFRLAIRENHIHTEDWYQANGVYGGLIFAQIITAVRRVGLFPIRRLNVDLCAPVTNTVCEIEITESRRGMNSQFLMFTVKQSEKVVTHGTVVCGGDRSNDLEIHHSPIPQPNVPQYPGIPKHPLMPAFTQHFEYWPTLGALPFSRASQLSTGGWIRSRHDSILDAEMIVALLDAWWPSMSLGLSKPRPMGTISIAIDLLWNDVQENVHPCFLENISLEVASGYSIEHNRLWRSDGTLLAIAQQNIVLIR